MTIYQTFRMKRAIRSAASNADPQGGESLFMLHVRQMIEFRNAIRSARETFSQAQIWPDECDAVIHRMEPLGNTAARLADSIERRSRKTPGGNRYPLLVSVHYVGDQVGMLLDYVQEYRQAGDRRSVKESKRKRIVESLHHLDAGLTDLMKELDRTARDSRLS